MIKAVSCVAILFINCLAAYCQAAAGDRDLLSWNPYYELQWYDFQGAADEEAKGDAGAAVQITAKPYLVKKEIYYNVDAWFNRKKSWVTDPTESLLKHERLHFDIAELYARKIRKKIDELQDNGVNDIPDFNHAIRVLLEESNNADRQYDIETLHGALSKKQAAWEVKVKEELEALDSYRKRKRVIGE